MWRNEITLIPTPIQCGADHSGKRVGEEMSQLLLRRPSTDGDGESLCRHPSPLRQPQLPPLFLHAQSRRFPIRFSSEIMHLKIQRDRSCALGEMFGFSFRRRDLAAQSGGVTGAGIVAPAPIFFSGMQTLVATLLVFARMGKERTKD